MLDRDQPPARVLCQSGGGLRLPRFGDAVHTWNLLRRRQL